MPIATDPASGPFHRRWALLAVVLWAALAAAMALLVPGPIADSEDGTKLYLPESLESQGAQKRLRELFPDQYRLSLAVVVFHRPEGLTPTDRNVRVWQLVQWIRNPTLPPDMPLPAAERVREHLTKAAVRSVATDPLLAPRLDSADRCSTMVLVGMPDIFTARRTQNTVRALRWGIAQMDLQGLEVVVTGDAGFYADYAAAAEQSVDRSTTVTLILVVAILLLVYRSPVAMMVPIVTIGVAVHTAMRLLFLLSAVGFEAGSTIQMLVVVIVFGSGTDYCLFIISRYKEEALPVLAQAAPGSRAALGPALWRAWKGTATAIGASALTTMAGLSLMSLAVFRAFQKAGPSVAVALAVGCLASLTLAPALYLLAGRAVFWPSRHGPRATRPLSGDLWQRIAALVTRRPGLVTIVVLLVLALPSAYSIGRRPTHNIFDELSPEWSSVRGYEILRDGYSPGTMGPATLLVEASQQLDEGRGWALLERLARCLEAHPMVAEVVRPGRPFGKDKLTLGSLDGDQALADTEEYFFHKYIRDEDSATKLFDRYALKASERIAREVSERILRGIRTYFFTPDGRAARLEIFLADGPYTDASVAAARDLQQTARSVATESALRPRVMLAGPSSTIADIKTTADRDFRVVTVAVLVAVYVILLVVLRRAVLGLFLIGGTVLSFMAALGAADFVFVRLMGEPGLDWKIQFFLLVLLVAVGVDYNIYVCTRIRQESRRRPPDEAVRVALARTGGIVSACGIIVAGTFASMIAGTLTMMIQLGFALALGILVDTFLVRPLMVPAVALMLSRAAERRKKRRSA